MPPQSFNVPKVQRSWLSVRRGHPSQALEFRTDAPVPTKLGKGEVLVKVQAAALNPVGYKVMKFVPNMLSNRPSVPEHDLAGIIVDANGTHFSNGDEVFGFIWDIKPDPRQGVLTEYTRLPASHVILRPPNVTPVQASGLTLVGLTAYQALFDVAHLEQGQTVFINGGSTAVGAIAIQIAKANGCKVVATASGRNEEFVRSLGADEFIDYTKEPLHKYLSQHPPATKYHVFFEAVGLIDPALYSHAKDYVAPNGVFLSVGPFPEDWSWKTIRNSMSTLWEVGLRPRWLGGRVRFRLISVKHTSESLAALRDLVAQGKVKPVVDSVYNLEDVQKAYEKLLSQRARGKVVIKVDESA